MTIFEEFFWCIVEENLKIFKKMYSYRFIFVLKLSLKSLFYLHGLTVEGHLIKWRVIFKDQLMWNIFQRLLTEYLWIWLEISTLHNSSWLWWTVYKWTIFATFSNVFVGDQQEILIFTVSKKACFLRISIWVFCSKQVNIEFCLLKVMKTFVKGLSIFRS